MRVRLFAHIIYDDPGFSDREWIQSGTDWPSFDRQLARGAE